MLTNRLQRIADVVCRGLAGYNTRWFKSLLPQLVDGIEPSSVSCVTIFLGANDAAHDSCPSRQHVPIPEYKTNLADIVYLLESIGIKKDRLILLNPPPYYHEEFVEARPDLSPCRSGESAAAYATACLEAGKELGVTIIDVHTLFSNDPRGRNLFTDGLHLAPAGSELLFNELWPWVERKIIEFKGGKVGEESLQQNFPYWMEFRDKFQIPST